MFNFSQRLKKRNLKAGAWCDQMGVKCFFLSTLEGIKCKGAKFMQRSSRLWFSFGLLSAYFQNYLADVRGTHSHSLTEKRSNHSSIFLVMFEKPKAVKCFI